MAIDVFGEEMVTITEAAKRLPRPRGTKPIHKSTMWRWASAGLKAKDGQIVRLETVRIGGTVCTSIEAMRRFFDRLQEQEVPFQPSGYGTDGLSLSASSRSPYRNRLTPERRRQQEEIAQKLDFELFGCDRLIDECGYSTETLREIFDRLCEKLPTTHITGDRTYETVRRAIFTRAVEIIQGLHGSPKGLKGAKAWIDSLDPRSMDVTQLKGCGAHTADEWKKLVEQGKIPSVPEDRALP